MTICLAISSTPSLPELYQTSDQAIAPIMARRKYLRLTPGLSGKASISSRKISSYLPPYSPDFNPIEMAFSKLKAALREAAARTIDELWQIIAEIIDDFTPTQCQNFFTAAGYEPD